MTLGFSESRAARVHPASLREGEIHLNEMNTNGTVDRAYTTACHSRDGQQGRIAEVENDDSVPMMTKSKDLSAMSVMFASLRTMSVGVEDLDTGTGDLEEGYIHRWGRYQKTADGERRAGTGRGRGWRVGTGSNAGTGKLGRAFIVGCELKLGFGKRKASGRGWKSGGAGRIRGWMDLGDLCESSGKGFRLKGDRSSVG